MRLVDWYLGLNLGQKIVVGVAVPVLVFVFAYLASILILLAAGVGGEDSPARGGRVSGPGIAQARRERQRVLGSQFLAEDKERALGGG